MKSHVQRILTEAVEDAEENLRWMSEALDRLRKDNGDPEKIEKYEIWHARNVEICVQCREAMQILT